MPTLVCASCSCFKKQSQWFDMTRIISSTLEKYVYTKLLSANLPNRYNLPKDLYCICYIPQVKTGPNGFMSKFFGCYCEWIDNKRSG